MMKLILLLIVSVFQESWGENIWEKDPEYDKFLDLHFEISTAEHSIHFAEIGKVLIN